LDSILAKKLDTLGKGGALEETHHIKSSKKKKKKKRETLKATDFSEGSLHAHKCSHCDILF
jgi:hypothetical protein